MESNLKLTQKKTNSSLNPLLAIGLLTAIGMTGTPSLSNLPTAYFGNGTIITTIPFKNEEDEVRYKPETSQATATISERNRLNDSFNKVDSTESFSDSKINTISDINFDQYLFGFINELDKHAQFLSISKSNALIAFVNSAKKISKIPFIKSSIDLLPGDGFKFVLKLSDSKILMASQYMVVSDIPTDFVVFSIFENRRLQESSIMQIDDFVNYVTSNS